MEDLKQIQEFFSKPLEENVDKKYSDFLVALRDSGITNMFGAAPYLQAEFGLDKREAREVLANWMRSFGESLEEGKQLDIEDFAKVVQAVTKTGHPVTVLLTPKFNEIEVLTGMNAPDDMLFDLSNAVDSLGYGRNDIIIAANSSNLSRREYSDIRRVNGGHKDYFEESLDEAYIVTYAKNKGEKPASAAYKLRGSALAFMRDLEKDGYITMLTQKPVDGVDEALNENEVTRYSGFNINPEDPDSEPFQPTGSVAEFKEDLRALFGKFKGDLKNPEFIEGVAQIMVNWKALLRSQLDENALGFNDSRLSSDQHRDLDYAVRGDSAYTFGNDPYADDQLRYKYAVKMGFLEEAKVEVDDKTEFKLNLKHLLDKHVVDEKEEMNEGASTEEKRIAMSAIKRIAKYRGVSEDEARNDLIRAAKEIGDLKEDLSDYEEKDADYDKLYSDYLYKMVKEVAAEKGYSKFLVSKDNPKGETDGLTTATMNKILMNVIKDLDETIKLGKNLNEELCPKGKAYIKKRQAAGEKSSAYLSGRAVKVCKGQMKG